MCKNYASYGCRSCSTGSKKSIILPVNTSFTSYPFHVSSSNGKGLHSALIRKPNAYRIQELDQAGQKRSAVLTSSLYAGMPGGDSVQLDPHLCVRSGKASKRELCQPLPGLVPNRATQISYIYYSLPLYESLLRATCSDSGDFNKTAASGMLHCADGRTQHRRRYYLG